ncbi:hydantoinase/oxoprolinase family protein, partial [Gammaproteobacteria bacterium]|nr:hydantoinase/oxoprolinase family protein [Gammaproteobacteria bacterium]
MRFDRVHTINTLLDDLDVKGLASEIAETAEDGQKRLSEADVMFEGIEHSVELDMLYLGQTHTVSVKVPVALKDVKNSLNIKIIRTAFETAYEKDFGRLLHDIGMRVLNLRVTVIGRRPKFDLSILGPSSDYTIEETKIDSREVWFDGKWWETDVYNRVALPKGKIVPGPALLEQSDTTIFVDPDLEGKVDKIGNLIISRKNIG